MTLVLILIVATALYSYKGFSDRIFFEKHKFNVGAVLFKKEYYRLVTAGFLHADWMHLIFNMMTLYFFSSIVLSGFETVGFLIIYFGSIIFGNIFSVVIYKHQSWYSAIGASGGVSGILFAAIAVFPHLELYMFFIPIPIKGYIFGVLYFGYSVYMMLNPKQWDNLGHAAHLGGAAFGLVYAVLLAPQLALQNISYLGIMAIPLVYLGYRLFLGKKL